MNKSRFGLNLFLQLVLIFGLYIVAWTSTSETVMRPAHDAIHAAVSILWLSFVFGMFYGFFRIFGVRLGLLEAYYQHFPLGFMDASPSRKPSNTIVVEEADFRVSSVPGGLTESAESPASFNWDTLFTPKYLRYAGFLLIISATFSILFRIEWLLINKVFATFALSVATLIGAEKTKDAGKPVIASVLMLIGFTSFQFGCTLLGEWYGLMHHQVPSMLPEILIFLKLAAGIALLPMVKRYSSDFAAPIYFIIVFLGPISLIHAGFDIPFMTGMTFVGISAVITLGFGLMTNAGSLFVINAVASNVYVIAFLTKEQSRTFASGQIFYNTESAWIALSVTVTLFVLHLVSAVLFDRKNPQEDRAGQQIHVVLIHVLAFLSLTIWIINFIPELAGNFGGTSLLLSLFPFTAFLNIQASGKDSAISSPLLSLAVVLSALGLFLETKGPWTAIVFLTYSCVVLWYSLMRGQRQTRIFAFGVLTASLYKLYFQSGELFDSISGSTAILVVGVILLVLANKMDTVVRFIKGEKAKQ